MARVLVFERKIAGCLDVLIKALHLHKMTLGHPAIASVAVRVARLAGVVVDDVLTGRYPGPGCLPALRPAGRRGGAVTYPVALDGGRVGMALASASSGCAPDPSFSAFVGTISASVRSASAASADSASPLPASIAFLYSCSTSALRSGVSRPMQLMSAKIRLPMSRRTA